MEASPPISPELQAEIVSIGTELLLGEISDTNASWLAGQLPALGIPLYRIQQVGDNRLRLIETLRQAWERANLLILTGGLGPTEDDVTREAIAGLLGETMAVVPALEAELRAFFARRRREMPDRNVKQATLIPSAATLPNPIGTAPGWWVRKDGRYIATMPGVPVEMRRMWQEQVVPRLLPLPRGGAIVSRTLKILGLGESMVEEQLGSLVRSANPTVATYAKQDGIHVRLAARAANAEAAHRLIEPLEMQVRAIFGAGVYGTDDESVADSLARLLREHGVRVAVAEGGLDGALCAALAGSALAGGLVLPADPGSESGAEAAGKAAALAQRARDTFGGAIGIGACLAQAGDRAWLAVGLSAADHSERHAEEHATDRSDAPRRAVLLALQVLRAFLLERSIT